MEVLMIDGGIEVNEWAVESWPHSVNEERSEEFIRGQNWVIPESMLPDIHLQRKSSCGADKIRITAPVLKPMLIALAMSRTKQGFVQDDQCDRQYKVYKSDIKYDRAGIIGTKEFGLSMTKLPRKS